MDKVCVVGLWHLGLVAAATLAELGYQVIGFDFDSKLIQSLNKYQLPLFEPGLTDLTKKVSEQAMLRFENDSAKAVKDADYVLITYDTPVDDNDDIDLSPISKAFKEITPHLKKDTLIIIHSQIPVGTSEKLQKQITSKRPGANIEIVYSLENLRLGNALEIYRAPDMIVIGSNTPQAREKADRFFSKINSERIHVSWKTAEMAKHAMNAFFATSISFANEIGNLCDAIGADGMQIAQILKKDSRIGKKAQVRPGLGFAGATLARDLRVLQNLGKNCHLPTQLTDSVLDINQKQTAKVVSMITQWFDGKLKGKIIAVLGLTYKPGTSTLRRSSSLEIMRELKKLGAILRAHDPKADLSELKGKPFFEYYNDPYQAADNADAVLLLTEWPEYKELDYGKISKSLRSEKKLLLDAKNHLDSKIILGHGLIHLEIGRGQLLKR